MTLTKKQVKALLEVISSDETRPVLCHAKVDTFEGKMVLVATDGYVLAALILGEHGKLAPISGKLIPRGELVKWYKLAGNKDMLTEDDLQAMAIDETEVGTYPVWQKLVPERKNFSAIAAIGFNAQYMMTIQTLAGLPCMTWEFFGKLAPMVARHDDNTYLVMPVKEGR